MRVLCFLHERLHEPRNGVHGEAGCGITQLLREKRAFLRSLDSRRRALIHFEFLQGGGSTSNSDHLEDAARALILEWVDKLFSERISSYRGLALFLIDKMYVDTQSAAAQALAASVAREHETIDGGTF